MKKAEESTVPTNNKKVEVHDATEKTTDVTPKQTETEHEKQVLTGTLAQKASQVAQALTKKAYGGQVIPGMAEDSELARTNHGIAQDELSDAPDRRAFGYVAPKVLGGAGNLIGGRLGGAAGKLTGQGLGIAAELGTALDNAATRRDAMIEDAGPRLPAPAAPKPAPQLPVGQPRPPVAQPPRGLGSASLNKAGAFAFGIKIANGWMGLNSSRNGPGGVISTKTLPKADATAKNWGPAGQLPPPSRGTTVTVPSSAQQNNGMKPITPEAFGLGIFNKMQ